VLLLDEPMAGMVPEESSAIAACSILSARAGHPVDRDYMDFVFAWRRMTVVVDGAVPLLKARQRRSAPMPACIHRRHLGGHA